MEKFAYGQSLGEEFVERLVKDMFENETYMSLYF